MVRSSYWVYEAMSPRIDRFGFRRTVTHQRLALQKVFTVVYPLTPAQLLISYGPHEIFTKPGCQKTFCKLCSFSSAAQESVLCPEFRNVILFFYKLIGNRLKGARDFSL
jgi:hypothetical protein